MPTNFHCLLDGCGWMVLTCEVVCHIRHMAFRAVESYTSNLCLTQVAITPGFSTAWHHLFLCKTSCNNVLETFLVTKITILITTWQLCDSRSGHTMQSDRNLFGVSTGAGQLMLTTQMLFWKPWNISSLDISCLGWLYCGQFTFSDPTVSSKIAILYQHLPFDTIQT